MPRYVLTERITAAKGAAPWRVRPRPRFERVSIYESFEEAKKEMRAAIARSVYKYCDAGDFFEKAKANGSEGVVFEVKVSGAFPLTEDRRYRPLKDYIKEFEEPDRDLLRLDGILHSLFTCEPPDYDESEPDICDEEYGIQPTAFILNPRLLNLTLDRKKIYSIETNAHNMKDCDETYYFIARVKDAHVWKTVFTIEITFAKEFAPDGAGGNE